MHTANEPLFIRNPLHKICELPLFVLRESREQGLRMFARNPAYRLERRAPFFCDVQTLVTETSSE